MSDSQICTHRLSIIWSVPVSSGDPSDSTIKASSHMVSSFSSAFSLLPQPPLSSLPSHLLVLDSVGPCGGAPHPVITWYWVNWVTLITSQPRISRKVWPSLITAAPAYLHHLRPCCYAPIGVCDSEERGRHADLEQGEGERPLMWEWGCVWAGAGLCCLWDRKQSGLVWEKAALCWAGAYSAPRYAGPAANSEWARCGHWEVFIVPGRIGSHTP